MNIALTENISKPGFLKDLWRSFWYLVRRDRRRYVLWYIILVVIHFHSVIPPLILGNVVDFLRHYHANDSLTPLIVLCLILGATYVVASLIRITAKNTVSNLRSDAMYHARVEGFEKLTDVTSEEHLKENIGAKAQRLQSGTLAFDKLGQIFATEVVGTFATLVGSIGIMAAIGFRYSVFLVVYALGFSWIISTSARRIRLLNDERNIALERATGSAVEGIQNVLALQASGAQNDFRLRVAKREDLARNFDYAIRRAQFFQWKVFQVSNGVWYALALFIVSFDATRGKIDVGGVVIFFGLLQTIIRSAGDVLGVYENFMEAASSLGRMMPILYAKPRVRGGDEKFPVDWDCIKILNGSFRYQGARSGGDSGALREVSLNMPRGQKVGIAGKSGSGKSTLAKILIGVLRIETGSYSIGGVEFNQIQHDDVMRNMALVLQETEMFNISVRENITLLREVPEDFLSDAIRCAALEDLISSLPNGLDTTIGERGYQLSGGERQRIAIARALCRNPQILVLDEATSALDSATEQRVHAAIEKAFASRTLIVIAHRVVTLKDMDVIYLFDGGRIVESGSFAELLSKR